MNTSAVRTKRHVELERKMERLVLSAFPDTEFVAGTADPSTGEVALLVGVTPSTPEHRRAEIIHYVGSRGVKTQLQFMVGTGRGGVRGQGPQHTEV